MVTTCTLIKRSYQFGIFQPCIKWNAQRAHTTIPISLNLLLPSQLSPYGSGPASCPRMIKNYIHKQICNILKRSTSTDKIWHPGSSCIHTPYIKLIIQNITQQLLKARAIMGYGSSWKLFGKMQLLSWNPSLFTTVQLQLIKSHLATLPFQRCLMVLENNDTLINQTLTKKFSNRPQSQSNFD